MNKGWGTAFALFLAAAVAEASAGSWRDDFASVVLLRDYNTRLVIISTALLGVAGGLAGSFLLLRKRSLMGDALSHATLPGIVLAFIVAVHFTGAGRSFAVLVTGAAVTGILGCVVVLLIRGLTRVKDDAAMGIVLSVFYGAGVVLLSIVQHMPEAGTAGLESFLYGKTASMVLTDFYLVSGAAVVALFASLALFKEFRLLCFDEDYARSMGWPTHALDVLMLLLVTLVTVVGLQAVGVVLIIAFLIIPAASARMWTSRFGWMLAIAAGFGGASGWLGSGLSALTPGLPAGAVIVLTAAALFVMSLLAGPDRGIVARTVRAHLLKRRIERQHLLRGIYEVLEEDGPAPQMAGEGTSMVTWEALECKRSWTPGELRRIVRRAYRRGLVETMGRAGVRLTDAGAREAARVTRNHRLWEIYLVEYADIAPSHVDRDADAVEHILGADLIRRLEATLTRAERPAADGVPASPHPIR
ncbi:MAG: metal ABC transporter permease [Opitutales bacterium]|nr:metal ABC transporter permease [Opitutales bacterium]